MSLILTGLAFTYTLNFKKLFSIKLHLSRASQFRGLYLIATTKNFKNDNLFFRKQTEHNGIAPSLVI